MAKRVNSASLKGLLEVDFNKGEATVTEIVKDIESEYDFFEILNEFNNKSVSITIKEENDIQPIEDSE